MESPIDKLKIEHVWNSSHFACKMHTMYAIFCKQSLRHARHFLLAKCYHPHHFLEAECTLCMPFLTRVSIAYILQLHEFSSKSVVRIDYVFSTFQKMEQVFLHLPFCEPIRQVSARAHKPNIVNLSFSISLAGCMNIQDDSFFARASSIADDVEQRFRVF